MGALSFAVRLVLLAAPALAQDDPPPEPEPASPPLAIPSGASQHEAVELDEARAQAIRQYRMKYLAVRSWAEVRSTTVYTDIGYGYGYGYPYGYPYGYGTGLTVASPMLWSEERWSVYRGPQRLNNSQYLELVGDLGAKADLERRIRKNRTVAGVFYGVAVAGGAATVSSLVGMDNAKKRMAWTTWRTVGLGGITGLFAGAVSGSFPSARARRLSTDPTLVRDWDALQDELLNYNEALRKDLGVSAQDALKVEGTR